MKHLIPLFLLITLFSCGNGSNSSAVNSTTAAALPAGYTLTPVAGTDLVQALKYSPEGEILEKGFFLNNQPEGTWYYYEHPTKEFPKRIATYYQGLLNGPYLEISEQGGVMLQAYYVNNELDGHWGSYRSGRPLKTADYRNGALHGVYREYVSTNGKLQKEIGYKDGKEDGMYRFYNEDGIVTLEYRYENGVKISGGIVGAGGAEGSE